MTSNHLKHKAGFASKEVVANDKARSKALKKKVEVKDRFTKSTLFNTRHSRDFVRKLEKGKKINPH